MRKKKKSPEEEVALENAPCKAHCVAAAVSMFVLFVNHRARSSFCKMLL